MDEILTKLINKEKITEEDIKNELYEICDRVHASCDSECPVFEKYNYVPMEDGDCRCFKNGGDMLRELKK